MKPHRLNIFILAVVIAGLTAGSLRAEDPVQDPLPSWNDGPAKQSITALVEKVTEFSSPDFVPPAERIATFDNDGTLWAEQPMYVQLIFALDRVKALAPQHPEWKEEEPFASILKGDVKGALAGGEPVIFQIVMATHAGMTTDEFEMIVREWITTARHPKTGRLYTEMVYQPMVELLAYLRGNGFKTFIVSGGGIEFMRPWTERVYGIPPEQVVGSSSKLKFEMRDGKATLMKLPELNFFDDKAGKPVGIQTYIGRRPIAAFGNSDGDLQMLQWTCSGAGTHLCLYVHHTDAAREWAYDRTSAIGRLDKGLDEAQANGWTVVSMKDDWKRVFAFDEAGGIASSPANNITGIQWRVAELSGHQTTASLHGEQPFILFDEAKRQVTGYAGCNRFFGGYELQGSALKFGPIGATKRACPDREEGIETAFFRVLDATRHWEVIDGTLTLLNDGDVLARLQKIQQP